MKSAGALTAHNLGSLYLHRLEGSNFVAGRRDYSNSTDPVKEVHMETGELCWHYSLQKGRGKRGGRMPGSSQLRG